jgi:hypothetical protein
MLNQYINDLSLSGELSEHNIEDSKFEQQKILFKPFISYTGIFSYFFRAMNDL